MLYNAVISIHKGMLETKKQKLSDAFSRRFASVRRILAPFSRCCENQRIIMDEASVLVLDMRTATFCRRKALEVNICLSYKSQKSRAHILTCELR